MKKNDFLRMMVLVALCSISSAVMAQPHAAGYVRPHSEVEANKPTENVPVETGMYTADWNNLAAWECPDWFRDAKFGIWAHWDPQCEAEDGDWYARSMYGTGNQRTTFYNYFGHYPDHDWGYKDFCRYWTVANWDPAALIDLYYSAGARYFMAMGQHHDNYDCWDSPYQEWNSMNIGPKRDIVGEWAAECSRVGMKLGVSMHGAHAWTFFEVGRNADTAVSKDEGTGKWWEGYDPQELYAQNHDHSANWNDWGTIHSQWHWGNGVCPPSVPYMQKFQNRVLQCINKYNPDMLYFDDTVLPFYGASTNPNDQFSLRILQHFYNHSAKQHDGEQQVVVTGKILEDRHKRSMLWDVERGIPDQCQELPWQTCTCIGGWHYSKYEGDHNQYKQADQVIRMLVDIVSKNGNLLLSIPVRGDGSIDNNERNIVNGIKAWMDINNASIYGTRPWKVYGEGPLFESANPLSGQGFNEGINYSSSDVRYVTKDGKVYATIMRWPSAGEFTFEAFSIISPNYSGNPTSVKLLGYGDVSYTFDERGLNVNIPTTHPNDIAPVFEITLEYEAIGYDGLQTLINMVDNKVTAYAPTASSNTGKYSVYAIQALNEKLDEAKALPSDASETEVAAVFETLRTAYSDFMKEGKNPGGALGTSGTNLTTAQLVEASGFSRSDGGSTRFGTPKYWTVENFTISNPNGTKNGIDNYPGSNTLMLGVWSGEDQGSSSDLTNARIYRKVHLEAGRYFFAATYNAAYQLNPMAYIFAASQLCNTADIPEQSLAYYPLAGTPERDGTFYGVEFSIDEEQDVYLGWQIDLTRGSGTQEMRVSEVRLFRRADLTAETLNTLISNVNLAIKKTQGKVNENTGYYSQAAVDKLQYYVELCTLPEDAPLADISNAYYMLEAAYAEFQKTALNPGGVADETGATDLTIEKLMEADNFSRKDESTTRFATPLYWKVEHFKINKGTNGTKNGLDNYDGTDALMLGVWDDRSNASGSLNNARISQTVYLEAGRYFFGARFSTIYHLNKAYIFAAEKGLTTTSIPSKSIAYYDINECKVDGQFYGIFFTLEEAQDVCLGFQANLTGGEAQQEFRASAVRLLRWGEDIPDAIEIIGQQDNLHSDNYQVYDLQGRRLQQEPHHGIYILRQNGKTTKIYK